MINAFRYRKRIAARGEDKESMAASRIAAAYKGKVARRAIKKLVAKAFAKKHVKQGYNKGKVYYVQVSKTHKKELVYKERPRLHRRYFPKIAW
jgi:hypothetical protein